MRKILALLTGISILVVLSCSGGGGVVKLEKGTPAYQLAKDISAKLPFFDPDKNNVIVSTKDFKITTGEVFQDMSTKFGNRVSQLKSLGADRLKSIIQQNVDALVSKKLLVNAAAKADVVVSDAEVDSVLKIQYTRAGGEQKFIDFISKNGFNIDFVKSDIKTNLTIQKNLDKQLAEAISIPDADIQKAYNEDKTATVQHILLNTRGKSDADKMKIHKKMEGILARARKGEDFGKLAKEYSEDPGSKKSGGLYKDFPKGRMVKPFEDAAFSVPPGKISDIVETQYGYHIIKVISRKKETKPFDQVKDQIKANLQKSKKNEAYQDYLKKLKSEANYSEVKF